MARGLATNLALQSQGMITGWTTNRYLAGTTGQSDPLGGTNATLWTEQGDGASAGHYTSATVTGLPAANTKVLVSWYVKPSTRNYAAFWAQSGAIIVGFDLVNLTSNNTAGSPLAVSVESVGGGWVRCSVLYLSAGSSDTFRFYAATSISSIQYTGSAGTNAQTTFGAMVEAPTWTQTTPSPYVVTGAAVASGPREWRQNLALQSAALASTPWNALNCTATNNAAADPAGGNNATSVRITNNAGSNLQTVAFIKGITYTFSAWIKRNALTNQNFQLRINDSSTTTLSGSRTATADWQRFSLTVTAAATGSGDVGFADLVLGLPNLLVWGAQLEQANRAGDYIGTTTAPANASGAPRSVVT